MTNEKFIYNLKRLQLGYNNALELIYEDYYSKIVQTAFRFVNSYADAEDIATNVIMKLWNYKQNPDEIQNHVGLLKIMTKNEALDFIKKEKHHINYSQIEVIGNYHNEVNLLLCDILSILSEEETDIFISHIIWDEKLIVFAKNNNIPYITVKRKYAEIKKKIKKLIQTNGKRQK